jgi:hypothetical protein
MHFKTGTKIENQSLGTASQFKYVGTAVTNQNVFQEEMKRRLSSGDV